MSGNFMFGYNFATYTPSTDSEDSIYPVLNISDYQHPLRRYQAQTKTSEVSVVLDLGSVKTVKMLMLNDVNFTTVNIEGSDNGTDYTDTAEHQAVIDERTQRYKLCIALTAFSHRYIRLRIPAQSTSDNLNFRIGSVVAALSMLEVAENPSFDYDCLAEEKTEKNALGEILNLGESQWSASFGWDIMTKANEGNLWTLNSIKKHLPLLFFENMGDAGKAYVCKRTEPISISWFTAVAIKTQKITLEEYI